MPEHPREFYGKHWRDWYRMRPWDFAGLTYADYKAQRAGEGETASGSVKSPGEYAENQNANKLGEPQEDPASWSAGSDSEFGRPTGANAPTVTRKRGENTGGDLGIAMD